MWATRPTLKTAPVEQPVSLAQLKEQAVVDFADDDSLLQALLDAAVLQLDGYTGLLGRCMVTQVWDVSFWRWAWRMHLPLCDVSAVALTYIDVNGIEQTIDPSNYQLVEQHARTEIWFKRNFSYPVLYWDNGFYITASMTAGFGAATAVPAPLKTAIMQLAISWYENRNTPDKGAAIPKAVEALIAPYRRVRP